MGALDMLHRLPPLNWLRTFESAARHLSFTAAAAELGVTQSAVSQQVRLLEQHLGRVLFHRLPRGLKLAEAGEALLPLLRDTFERLATGTAEIFGAPVNNRLMVRATTGFALLWLAPRLQRFHAAHPDIGLHVITSIWPAEYTDPSLDLEIRCGGGHWPGLEAERLSWDEVFPVCSPALGVGPRPLCDPADLASHVLLHVVGFQDGWTQWLARAGVADRVDASGGLTFDTAAMALELAAQGAGVALGRSCYVREAIETGRLIAPFKFAFATDEAFYLVAPKERPRSRAATAFRDWLLAEALAAHEGIRPVKQSVRGRSR